MTLHERLAPGKYRLRADDYRLLADAGAFGEQRTELIEGDVIVMSPRYRPHGMAKLELYDELLIRLRAIGSPYRPVTEFTLALSDDTMPDPDIMLTSEPRGEKAVPVASVALIIEVADTTFATDMGVKAALYAGHRIAEYWVVDVNDRLIYQMWAPVGDTYIERREVRFGDSVISATITDLQIETSEL